MELKVWVEGIQRIVCGVTDATTCQDVVFALAHATGKSGRFTLIERWRNNERLLSPSERPLKILTKWGEYSNDVQFILQWSEGNNTNKPLSVLNNNSRNKFSSPTASVASSSSHSAESSSAAESKSKTLISQLNQQDNVGIVRGVPQQRPLSLEVRDSNLMMATALTTTISGSPRKMAVNVADGGGSSHHQQQQLKSAPPYKDPPAPPPYRDPPPPSSTSAHQEKYKKSIVQDGSGKLMRIDGGGAGDDNNKNKFQKIEETVVYNAQYRELVNLVNLQREKLSSQQADLTKYDAEIMYWESKEREKQFQLDFLSQEITTMTNTEKTTNEQIQALGQVEEESELVKQQEKTLKTELTALRSKLSNCETELSQCKDKMRLVMDEMQLEQRVQLRRTESRKQIERNLVAEMERLQRDVEVAKQSTEMHHLTTDTLKKEVGSLEAAIVEKKKQVEHLVTEMKEANLLSLTVAPPDDLHGNFEGPNRTGSTRKMIGSPRQLENAVPTNKNPHGVWV